MTDPVSSTSTGAASAAPVFTASAPRPSPAQGWVMVGMLFLAGILSVIDRAALNILVDPVRGDLGISDEQIGLLQGLAFGLFYAFMGLPMGLLADRISRRNLIAGGIALWSVATIGSGLAQSFGWLFGARLLVGLGEAALGPAAISLIADLFAPERRGRPISVYMMGQGLANGIAISVTGLLVAAAAAGTFDGLPLVGHLVPWRMVFVIFGAIGLLVSATMLFLTREPPRQDVAAQGVPRAPGAAEAAYLWRNRAILMPLYLAFALVFTVAYGSMSWAPTMLIRSYGADAGFMASFLGPVSIVFSAFGPLLGGTLLDRSMRSGNTMARFAILSLAPFFALPSIFAVISTDLHVASVMVASSNAVFSVIGTVMFATLQSVVPPRMRGSSISLTLVLNTILGASLGPLLVATFTQRVLQDESQVGWSIAWVCLPFLLISAGLYALSWRAMRKARANGGSECAALIDGELA
ncbi:MFS transporter [Novosphingobium mangrovi (ex Hu et al. 2023)]|uniref:MFS transporter n=1 Tax=Novosphingobium mangrovi (ex Hu et al. 2023) TaxID=2930094 RepID=A0ABT0AFD2_9SPHN|nr:MFS transporter [Novosphingobium mangrovi (ex Hu et al. 2023)]MCJ1961896.1 MFS transporter [Novosphingobium mangrovi (ex Hu et al. 2023)]